MEKQYHEKLKNEEGPIFVFPIILLMNKTVNSVKILHLYSSASKPFALEPIVV